MLATATGLPAGATSPRYDEIVGFVRTAAVQTSAEALQCTQKMLRDIGPPLSMANLNASMIAWSRCCTTGIDVLLN
jgi:hypothetical protein